MEDQVIQTNHFTEGKKKKAEFFFKYLLEGVDKTVRARTSETEAQRAEATIRDPFHSCRWEAPQPFDNLAGDK